jgi:hypothetical protein
LTIRYGAEEYSPSESRIQDLFPLYRGAITVPLKAGDATINDYLGRREKTLENG